MFPGLTNVKTNNSPSFNTNGLGPDNTMKSGVATQDLGGNSLTQQLRSVQNLLATLGSDAFTKGMGIADTGMQGFNEAGDTTRTALGTTNTALDTTRGALGTLAPAEDYWSKLLSGDKKTSLQAVAPAAAQASANYANAATNASQNMTKGGYAGVLGASLPQTQASEVNNMIYQLAPTAATNLNAIAGTKNSIAGTQSGIGQTQSNIGGVQGQLANWLASLGIDISKLGLTGLDSASQSLLGGRGQDVAEHGQAMSMATTLAGDVMSGIPQGMNAYANMTKAAQGK